MEQPLTTGPGCFALNRKPHFVYECWSDSQCLYVGLTKNVGSRLAAHGRTLWWSRVRRVECHWFPDKEQAMLRERNLIERYQPVNNWQGTAQAEGSRSGLGAGGVAWRKADVVP